MTDDEALLLVAPELVTVPEERREYFLGVMRDRIRADLGQHALALAAAHALTLSVSFASGGGSTGVYAGAIVSEKEGDLSRTFADSGAFTASSGSIDPYWAQTPYGIEYWSLVVSSTFTARNRMM